MRCQAGVLEFSFQPVFPDKDEQSQVLFTLKTQDLAYTLCLFLVENLSALSCSIAKASQVSWRCWEIQNQMLK